jgi:3-oxoacyl-[acyl-carrier protein] reductase
MTESILVTGASRGIGRAISVELAQQGFAVIVHYVNDSAGAEKTVADISAVGGQARTLKFDISDREVSREVLESDIAEHGCYFGVVCNAGVTRDASFPQMLDEEWDTVLRTNLDGFYNVVKPLVMPMVRRRKPGRIVALSSISGLYGNRGQVNYAASKAGIIGAVKALSLELAKRQITVNCVAPGLIATDMTAALPAAELARMIPLRRLGAPEDVAKLVGFLCSDGAAYITRQVISIDGGLGG